MLEPTNFENRQTFARVGSLNENFAYDAQGKMVRMPQLEGTSAVQTVTWNFFDLTKKLDLGGGGERKASMELLSKKPRFRN